MQDLNECIIYRILCIVKILNITIFSRKDKNNYAKITKEWWEIVNIYIYGG